MMPRLRTRTILPTPADGVVAHDLLYPLRGGKKILVPAGAPVARCSERSDRFRVLPWRGMDDSAAVFRRTHGIVVIISEVILNN